MKNTCDIRDLTREPPAMLDPKTILKARAMIADAAKNGYRPWPYGSEELKRQDWIGC